MVKIKRMDKLEYINEDVVMYDNKIMVVKEPRDGSHFDLSCPKEGLVYCFVGVDEISQCSLHLPFFLRMDGVRDKYTLGIVVFQELNFVQTAVLVGLFQ